MRTIYLDNAATTPIDPGVRDAMTPWLNEAFFNPSSRYPQGVHASEAIDRARSKVARALGARSGDVTFTAGGTEANNMAVFGLARVKQAAGKSGGRIVIGPTEHPSVEESARALVREGFEVVQTTLDSDGRLDLEALDRALTPETVLVCQMFVNNEFGSVYPIREVARRVRARSPRAAIHVDAVQALGKLELSLEELGVDSMSASAHKVHAPKGAGSLVTRPNLAMQPLLYGGGQEQGRRSGTENVAGIVAWGEAARLADEHREASADHYEAIRLAFSDCLGQLDGVRLIETGAGRDAQCAAICSVFFPGPPGEVWQHHLEARGVLVSIGSACQAKRKGVSPALLALGLGADQARQVLRFSFARTTTVDEIQAAGAVMTAVSDELRAIGH
ncbi:MAG: cysteine desulfurase [Chlamydiales bacterium]|jgi:cysteine desulfurase